MACLIIPPWSISSADDKQIMNGTLLWGVATFMRSQKSSLPPGFHLIEIFASVSSEQGRKEEMLQRGSQNCGIAKLKQNVLECSAG